MIIACAGCNFIHSPAIAGLFVAIYWLWRLAYNFFARSSESTIDPGSVIR